MNNNADSIFFSFFFAVSICHNDTKTFSRSQLIQLTVAQLGAVFSKMRGQVRNPFYRSQ